MATHTAEYQGYTYKGVAGGRFLGDNLHFSEVSSVGSMGHFVDLDQENASALSPSRRVEGGGDTHGRVPGLHV